MFTTPGGVSYTQMLYNPRMLWVERLEQRQLLSAAIARLTLINADSDRPFPGIDLHSGVVLDLAKTGRHLSVRADATGGSVGSVRFNYDGNPGFRMERVAPYTLAGDVDGGSNYLPW